MTQPKDGLAELPEAQWFEGGLRFKCTGCGNCCTGAAGSVYLSPLDLERLAAHFALPAGRFARTYTRLLKGRRVLLDSPATHDCVFLKDRTCSVYTARPTQCRTYPWWVGVIDDAQSWEEAGQVCEGVNHPDAPLVAASEILEQRRIDLENEASVERRPPRGRR